jgi:hypothetical protein
MEPQNINANDNQKPLLLAEWAFVFASLAVMITMEKTLRIGNDNVSQALKNSPIRDQKPYNDFFRYMRAGNITTAILLFLYSMEQLRCNTEATSSPVQATTSCVDHNGKWIVLAGFGVMTLTQHFVWQKIYDITTNTNKYLAAQNKEILRFSREVKPSADLKAPKAIKGYEAFGLSAEHSNAFKM